MHASSAEQDPCAGSASHHCEEVLSMKEISVIIALLGLLTAALNVIRAAIDLIAGARKRQGREIDRE